MPEVAQTVTGAATTDAPAAIQSAPVTTGAPAGAPGGQILGGGGQDTVPFARFHAVLQEQKKMAQRISEMDEMLQGLQKTPAQDGVAQVDPRFWENPGAVIKEQIDLAQYKTNLSQAEDWLREQDEARSDTEFEENIRIVDKQFGLGRLPDPNQRAQIALMIYRKVRETEAAEEAKTKQAEAQAAAQAQVQAQPGVAGAAATKAAVQSIGSGGAGPVSSVIKKDQLSQMSDEEKRQLAPQIRKQLSDSGIQSFM